MRVVIYEGDELQLEFRSGSDHVPTPVPDHLSADHLESLCNMLSATLPIAVKHDTSFDTEKFLRYRSAIRYARERAEWLRNGESS